MGKDIIIIGGGPSGLSTALHLHRTAPHLTPRILILEKEHYPRFKLCAGGLTVDAETILERLGLDVNEVPHVFADNVRFDFESKGLNIRNTKRHVLRVIRRDEFDHWLAEKAESRGIEIREGVTVRNIIPDDDCMTIETDQVTFHAKVVVGADGSNGITRRCVFPNAPVYTARVLEVITPSQPPLNSAKLNLGEVPAEDPLQWKGRWGYAYFEFSPVPKNIAGYIWDFPTQIKGEPMRCWGIYDANILAYEQRPQLKELLSQEMERRGFSLSDYKIMGHPIRWFSPDNPISAPRVLLVGDAAGADSIFGEGISIALGYGNLAARAIKDAFEQNDFSFRSYKLRMLTSPLGQALFSRWLITCIIYPLKWKWFQFLLWRILKPIVVFVAWVFVLNWGRRMPRL